MNATVITTGPGVIMATATASRNCRSSSQRNSWTTPAWRNGTIARPLPKTNAPASVKYQAILHKVAADAGGPSSPARIPGTKPTESAVRVVAARSRAPGEDGERPRPHEDPDDLRLRPRGDERGHDEEDPEEPVPPEGQPGELRGAPRDDRR